MKHYGWLAFISVIAIGCSPSSTDFASSQGGPRASKGDVPESDGYAYGSSQFSAFVSNSLHKSGNDKATAFYDWMQLRYTKGGEKYDGVHYKSFTALLDAEKAKNSMMADDSSKAAEQMKFASFLHRFIKQAIPRFSLDRGFEFSNAMAKGERQCFLQSVLVASLLQRTGSNAGVAMVWRNIEGQTTNNGHAVALARLADGRDVIVDCSDRTPFVKQQGLFARIDGEGYRFVSPQYQSGNSTIVGYALASGESLVPARKLQTLDIPFLNSQFDYYRGERAPGGFIAATKTPSGLAASERHLEASVRACPKNPLAVYVLGRVHLRQGKRRQALKELSRAKDLYAQDGWIPEGATQALSEVQ